MGLRHRTKQPSVASCSMRVVKHSLDKFVSVCYRALRLSCNVVFADSIIDLTVQCYILFQLIQPLTAHDMTLVQ